MEIRAGNGVLDNRHMVVVEIEGGFMVNVEAYDKLPPASRAVIRNWPQPTDCLNAYDMVRMYGERAFLQRALELSRTVYKNYDLVREIQYERQHPVQTKRRERQRRILARFAAMVPPVVLKEECVREKAEGQGTATS